MTICTNFSLLQITCPLASRKNWHVAWPTKSLSWIRRICVISLFKVRFSWIFLTSYGRRSQAWELWWWELVGSTLPAKPILLSTTSNSWQWVLCSNTGRAPRSNISILLSAFLIRHGADFVQMSNLIQSWICYLPMKTSRRKITQMRKNLKVGKMWTKNRPNQTEFRLKSWDQPIIR